MKMRQQNFAMHEKREKERCDTVSRGMEWKMRDMKIRERLGMVSHSWLNIRIHIRCSYCCFISVCVFMCAYVCVSMSFYYPDKLLYCDMLCYFFRKAHKIHLCKTIRTCSLCVMRYTTNLLLLLYYYYYYYIVSQKKTNDSCR